jgi:YHS domain-containing protein
MDPAAGLEMEEPLNYGTLEDLPTPPPPRRRRPLVVIGGCLVLMGVAATASTRTNLSVKDYPHAHAAAPFHGCALIDKVLRTCNRNAGDSLPLLQGMDIMSYFDASQGLIDQPVRGTKEFVSVYEGNTLYFSSEKNMNTFSYDPSKYMPAGGGYCPLAMSGLDPALSWVCTSVSPIDPLSYEVDSQGRLWLYREPSALFSMAEVYGEWLDSNVKGPSPYSQALANWANLVALRTGTGQLYPPTMMNKNGHECMDLYGLLKDDDGGDRFLASR